MVSENVAVSKIKNARTALRLPCAIPTRTPKLPADLERDKCLAAGMDGYVSKPIDRTKLFIEIERVMEVAIA